MFIVYVCADQLCYHDGCRCIGTKQAPGHQQPPWWLDHNWTTGLVVNYGISNTYVLEIP